MHVPVPDAIGTDPSPIAQRLRTSGLAALARLHMLAPALFVATLLGACGIIYRTLAFRLFSSLPTGFDGPMVFRQKYLLANHHFLAEPLPVYSYWSGVVNAELGTYLMDLINALVLQMSAWTAVQPRVLHQLLLTPALIGVALVLLVRATERPPRVLHAAVVAALATLGSPVVINFLNGWNVAYAWVLLLAITLVYVSNLGTTWKLGLTLLIGMTGPPLYHSFGFLLTVYIVLLWCGTILFRTHSSVASPLTVLVLYGAYQIYVSTLFFGSLVRGLRDVLDLSFLVRERPVIAVSRIQVGAIDLQYLHLFLYALLAVPILVAVLRLLRSQLALRRTGSPQEGEDSTRYLAAITCISAAIGVFALLFGLRFSVEFLINRGASYMSIPATLAVIDELRQRRRFHWYVYPLTIVAVAVSVYSFGVQSRTAHASTNLTHPEATGYAWLRERITPADTIFTDFRLSGPFVADGYFRVVGITGEGTEPTKQLLQQIYGATTPAQITAGIDQIVTYRDGHTARFLFLSKLMTKDYPGLNGYSTRFEPAPDSFFQLLRGSADWRLIYENEDAIIFERTKAGS